MNDSQLLNILLDYDVNDLNELNRDLDELIDNECKNEERQSDSDNSGDGERVVETVSVGS